MQSVILESMLSLIHGGWLNEDMNLDHSEFEELKASDVQPAFEDIDIQKLKELATSKGLVLQFFQWKGHPVPVRFNWEAYARLTRADNHQRVFQMNDINEVEKFLKQYDRNAVFPGNGKSGRWITRNYVTDNYDDAVRLAAIDRTQPNKVNFTPGVHLVHGDDSFSIWSDDKFVQASLSSKAKKVKSMPKEAIDLIRTLLGAGEGPVDFPISELYRITKRISHDKYDFRDFGLPYAKGSVALSRYQTSDGKELALWSMSQPSPPDDYYFVVAKDLGKLLTHTGLEKDKKAIERILAQLGVKKQRAAKLN